MTFVFGGLKRRGVGNANVRRNHRTSWPKAWLAPALRNSRLPIFRALAGKGMKTSSLGAINTFTDAEPLFPYQSSEARQQLGIPNSPVIHLAITDLAQRLLDECPDFGNPPEILRITALRSGSYGARESRAYEAVAVRHRAMLGSRVEQEEIDLAYALPRMDWLGLAMSRLEAEGIATDPRSRQHSPRAKAIVADSQVGLRTHKIFPVIADARHSECLCHTSWTR